MSEATAIIKVVGKDAASGTLRKVRNSVKDLGQESKKQQRSMDSLFGGIAQFATIGAIGLLGKNIIDAASNLEELGSKARYVFKEDFADVERQVANVAEAVGRASSGILQMSADMGAVLSPMGLAGAQMADMSVKLSRLAVDMASFHNSSDIEAFTALRSAITGETEPMKRFGVVLTETNLKLFAHSKGVQTQVKDMNQAQKTLLRYNFLMESTTDVQGDATRTADSFANQLRRLQGTVRELFETLGTPALPKLSKALEVASDFIKDVFVPAIHIAAQEWRSLMILIGQSDFGSRASENFKSIFGGTPGEVWGLVTGESKKITNYQRDLGRGDVDAAVSAGLNVPLKKATEATADLAKEIESLGGGGLTGGGGGGSKTKEDLEDLQEEIKEVQEAYGEARRDIYNNIKELEFEHDQKMQDMQDDISDLRKSLSALEKDYRKTLSAFDSDEIKAAADQIERVKDLEQDLADLRLKAERENKAGSVSLDTNNDIADKIRQLEQERAALEAFLAANPGFESKAKEESGKTDFEKEIERIQMQREEENERFEEKKTNLQEELEQAKEKIQVEQEAYTRERQELEQTKVAIEAFHGTYVAKLNDANNVTQEIVDDMKKKLEELKKTISSIDALMQANAAITGGDTIAWRVASRREDRGGLQYRAAGGLTTTPYTMVGEFGPEMVRLPYGSVVQPSQQSKGSSPVTLSIGRIEVRNEADENRLIEKLQRMIQLQSLKAS